MSVHQVYPENYSMLLDKKSQYLREQLAEFKPPELEVFASADQHFRQRAEFKIWHDGDKANYAMYAKGEYKKTYIIDRFDIGSELINQLMQKLLPELNHNEILKRKLFQVEFLTGQSGDALITLIYHKPLDDDWEQAALALQGRLNTAIIGRSRKQKRVLERDHIIETLNINERQYRYQQVESSFTQPNAGICEKMIEWAMSCCKNSEGDLLELYCGNGNFTIPLASQFDQVLATEISKTSVNSAQVNFELNQQENIIIARMSAEELSQAMDGEREFRRLKDIDLKQYNFSTVLVDPPRAGLDKHTEEMVCRFDQILYVSCNPQTLQENLRHITKTHQIERLAFFDQFPYTDHIETGVWLKRRN